MEDPRPLQQGFQIDQTTILSLLTTLLLLLTSYLLSIRFLPRTSPPKLRFLFIWHSFDALIHTCLEGSFLYNCFLTSSPIPPLDPATSHPASWSSESESLQLTPPGVYFLADARNLYGSAYAGPGNYPAKLWIEYARADRRWAGADLTVVSLEILTVGVGAPLAAYVCWLCTGRGTGVVDKRMWLWASWLAVGELYGGFMTFAPEWLSGNTNLDTSNWMYKWLYLVFFNMLWVVLPVWVLWQTYNEVGSILKVDRRKKER